MSVRHVAVIATSSLVVPAIASPTAVLVTTVTATITTVTAMVIAGAAIKVCCHSTEAD